MRIFYWINYIYIYIYTIDGWWLEQCASSCCWDNMLISISIYIYINICIHIVIVYHGVFELNRLQILRVINLCWLGVGDCLSLWKTFSAFGISAIQLNNSSSRLHNLQSVMMIYLWCETFNMNQEISNDTKWVSTIVLVCWYHICYFLVLCTS